MNPHTALESFQRDNDRAIDRMVRERQRALKSTEADLMVSTYCTADRFDAKVLEFVQRINALSDVARHQLVFKLLAPALALPDGLERVERKLIEAELLNVRISRKGAK